MAHRIFDKGLEDECRDLDAKDAFVDLDVESEPLTKPKAEEPKEVEIRIADAAGKTIRTFTAPARQGLNRAAWDLTTDSPKAFPSVLGAEQLALVGEIGGTEVWDLPDPSVLRYEGEGTDTGGGLTDVTSCGTYVTVPGIGQIPVPSTCPAGSLRNR